MKSIELTEVEWNNLRALKDDAPYKLMMRKSEALMLLHQKVVIAVVATFVDRSESTIETWIHDWHNRR